MTKRRKPWIKSNRRGKRKVNIRMARERILIICEGEKTEPNYFKSFPVDKEIVEVSIRGKGMNTDSLVETAISMRDDAEMNGRAYNQVWCVFDRDSFPKQNFNRAIHLAESRKIRVAYSNEAFEI